MVVLKQGDVFGLFSVLFSEDNILSAVAKSNVRVLLLDRDFLIEKQQTISELQDAIIDGEDIVDSNGIPLCDFRQLSPKKLTPKQKLRRCVQLVKRFNVIQKSTGFQFRDLLVASWEEKKKILALEKEQASSAGQGIVSMDQKLEKNETISELKMQKGIST